MAFLKFFAPVLAVMLLLHFFLATVATIDSDSDSDSESNGEDQFKWHVLSAKNFSSQIHLYPHILLLITVPWCGESRSLMKAISQKLSIEQQKYDSLKLMLIHRDRDKVLADSLDAVEGITFVCYKHAMSFKYQGFFRVQDILSSIHYLISLAPEELPLKRLNDAKDLETFLASTDKAVLLLESCGWTSKLLAKQNGNISVQGDVISGGLNEEINRTLASQRQKNLKEIGNDTVNCEVENGCGGSPWIGEFSGKNGTNYSASEDVQSTFDMSCSYEAFKKFESFFSKFVALARTFYLPPQRQRYGVVSERSLLSPLGVEISDQWSLIISYVGCSSCLRILKEEKHLGALEVDDLPVMELEDRRNDVGHALPIDKPSMLLFVDKTSDCIETRRKSQEALQAFREVARKHWKPYQVDGQHIDWSKRSSLHNYQASASVFGNHRLLLSPSSQKKKLKDKMSIMIINEGESVTLDNEALNLQSGSLREILTHLLGQKKQSKLSALAKEAGFQLLSNDMDVKIADVLSETNGQYQDSVKSSVEVSDSIDMNKDQTDKNLALVEQEEQSRPINSEAAYIDDEQTTPIDVADKEFASLNPHQSLDAHETASVEDVDSKVQTGELTNNSEGVKYHYSSFTGSFFFADGRYQFLRSLTNSSEIPRIVIIDPISQQHYVFGEVLNISFSSISSFIDGFINRTLTPYERSGPLRYSVEMPHPPYVNLDFHEKDSIPSVTTDTFSELVFGSSQFDPHNTTNAWHRDVLVLFSSSWCGFCQRMELVVREVYRALEGYKKMIKCETTKIEGFSKDDLKDADAKLPKVYSIDCTVNECGSFLKSVGQSEVYPTLLLYPARRKTVVSYNGNMMVADVIKFIVSHGSSSHHLARLEGILSTDWEGRDTDNKFKDVLMSGSILESADHKDKQCEAVLKDEKFQNQVTFKLNEAADSVSIRVGSFLVASDIMHGLNPFSEARILLVGADSDMGFQGLIVNKPISWRSVPDFENAEMLEEALLSFGGPVILEGMPLVSLTRSSLNLLYPQVLPGVFFLDQLATANEIEHIKAGNRSATEYWFFWGYSGWSWDQLFGEIAAGVWSLHEGTAQDLQWT